MKDAEILAVNPFNLKKDELLLFLTGRCRHHHYYYEHSACFVKEMGRKPTIGFLDIETSNLQADFGIVLSYAIKKADCKKIYSRVITKDELMNGTLDKEVVRQCIEDMSKFDVIISYFGSRFDIPFLRSRALYWKLEFPKYGYIKHKDVYYMVKNRLRLHRNRLEDACRLLGISGKTHLDGTYWVKALTGDKKSLRYILDHNKRDVILLEQVYNKLNVYARETKRSI